MINIINEQNDLLKYEHTILHFIIGQRECNKNYTKI